MNYLDWILIGVILVGIILGAMKGFLEQLFSLLAIIGGYFASKYLAGYLAVWLSSQLGWSESWTPTASYIIIFILVFILIKLIAIYVSKIGELEATKGLNMGLGAVFGGLKFIGFLIIIDFLLFQIEFPPASAIEESQYYKLIRNQSALLDQFIELPSVSVIPQIQTP